MSMGTSSQRFEFLPSESERMNPYSVRRKSLLWFPYEIYTSSPLLIVEGVVIE